MNNRTKYYNEFYSVDVKLLPSDKDIRNDVSALNDAENSLLFPQDPTTGQLADLLSQVLNTENPLLRDSLMSKLETLPLSSSALNGVDDETKIQLLKPRSCQSLSEIAEYTKFVESAIDQLNNDHSEPENTVQQEQQEVNAENLSE